MFDKYIIVDDSLRETDDGFAFDARLGYYRGLGLSMIEDLQVSIDGEVLPRGSVSLDEGDGPLTLAEMESAYDRRWPFGGVATIAVKHAAPLPPDGFDLGLKEVLRISYLPFPLIAEDRKPVSVAAGRPV